MMERNERASGPKVEESKKIASQTLSSKTTSHKTDQEDLSKPNEGIIHKRKTDTTIEQEKTTRKQTETRNMVLTGKYEDIAPIIYKEMAKYGGSPTDLPGPRGRQSDTPLSSIPVVTSGSKKVAYSETKVSFLFTKLVIFIVVFF